MNQTKRFHGEAIAAWLFVAFIVVWGAIVISSPSYGETYDATKPADNSKVASFPQEARTNFEALRKNGIANAGTLASYTLAQVMGETFTGVASTTSTTLYNSSGTVLLLGTATGTYNIMASVSTSGYATASCQPFGGLYIYTVWVATTTEIGNIFFFGTRDSSSANFNLSIATSSTRGQITYNASGSIGPTWTVLSNRNR